MPDPQVEEFLSLVQIENYEDTYSKDIRDGKFFGLPLQALIAAEKRLRSERSIAYFSMEYGLASSFYNRFSTLRRIDEQNESREHEVFSNYRLADYFFTVRPSDLIDLPIYSGGLGVLAGDTLKTMADFRLPAAGIGMLWSTGYFRQKFWFKYGQAPEEMHWDPYTYPGLIPLKNRIKLSFKSGELVLRLWKYYVYNYTQDYAIPLILLDSNIPENSENNRHLTDQLYRSESNAIRIMQRAILGMGGARALADLGYNIDLFHLNEGHAVFAFVEKARGLSEEALAELKKHFAYTCHTPVEAGHDRFPFFELERILRDEDAKVAERFGTEAGHAMVNLTQLAIEASNSVNAVSKRHYEVMLQQFPQYKDKINFVTNGVHTHTWMSENFKRLFEKFEDRIGDIKANPYALKKAEDLKSDSAFRQEVFGAHQENKVALCNMLAKWKLDKDTFTVCWARRMAAYKRPSLVLQDINRLISIAKKTGPIQVILAGKAHPKDSLGFTYINQMLDKIDGLSEVYDYLKVIMLENYDIAWARRLVQGVDVWLNNPLPPFEASGTSGMKAIMNSVLQLTTLDGWVVEATEEMGRIFGYQFEGGKIGSEFDLHMAEDASKLYDALEEMARLYYKTNASGKIDYSSSWIDLMINCLIQSERFNTYRMLDEYKSLVWKMPEQVRVGV
ncbi:MAG: alpha-glucan family phosphorylase [Candidatus Omnitrophica bacterium]|nr:alpha-glucan family phosphorylase [Candidatus Omnitrophota bacterium]